MAEIKRTDVNALAGKLKEFAQELPEQEKNVMDWILTRARSASEELSEESLESVAGGLAESLGFGAGTDSIAVGWTLSGFEDE